MWDYNNFSLKIEEITDIDENSQRITAVYYDSIGSKVWTEEFIRNQDNIYWQKFKPYLHFMPHITFDPPIQISPISDELGDTKTMTIREISQDSVDIYNDISVNYEIESIEGITVASGYYADCIKMRLSINYVEKAEKTYFGGNYYYWFAKGVGPVKVVTPSTSAELKSADLGIRKIP